MIFLHVFNSIVNHMILKYLTDFIGYFRVLDENELTEVQNFQFQNLSSLQYLLVYNFLL